MLNSYRVLNSIRVLCLANLYSFVRPYENQSLYEKTSHVSLHAFNVSIVHS